MAHAVPRNRCRTILLTVLFCLLAARTGAVIKPAENRAFNLNADDQNIITQMLREAGNPLLNQTVVRIRNNAPVDVDGDQVPDYLTWSGTLIASEWVLTCAHALQGTDGQGAGINVTSLECETEGGQVIGVAEFHVHEDWQKEQYLLGNDIALVRLAGPVAAVTTFARLSATPFAGSVGVLIAGFGEEGDGDAGGNGFPDFLSAGVNVLDVVGGGQTTDGSNSAYVPFPTAAASVAFMDFDKWELSEVVCDDPVNGRTTNDVPVALSAFSTMGFENEVTSPPVACAGPIDPANGLFAATVCDFIGGEGDSGGPAFLWSAFPNFPAPDEYYLTGTPVIYGIASFLNPGAAATADSVYGNVAGFTLVQPHLGWIYQRARAVALLDSDHDGRTDEAELLAGTDPYRAPLAPSTFIAKPLDITLQNIRILGETPVGTDETDIEFSADLLNTDSGRYFELALLVDRELLPATAAVTDPQLNYATLPELGAATAGTADTLVVRVANADLAAVRGMILSGELLQVAGFEEQVYSAPTRFIDAPTDEAFEATTGNGLGELVLVFGEATDLIQSLQPGDLLIADTASGGYRPKQPPPTGGFAVPYLSQQIPFEIASVTQVGDKTHVAGHKRELLEILKSGTFLADDENFNGSGRDLLDPPLENTYTEEEQEDRAEAAAFVEAEDPNSAALAGLRGLSAIPWHFNELKITDYLQLSGEVLLRSSGLRFQISFRDFAIKRASVGIDAGITASLLLETTGSSDNTTLPLVDKQKELARIPLPGVPITIAGVPATIGPTFVLAVGAEATAPAGLTIPLESAITVGAEVGWDNGQTFATPIQEFIAPRVSDPTVFDDLAASASAWVDARLEINVSVAGGLATAGPALGIRAVAEMEVAPLENPWWTLHADAELFGRFDLSLLGFNVVGVEVSQPVATFFHRDAGGPLVPVPQLAGPRPALQGFDKLSGSRVRWARVFQPTTSFGTFDQGFVLPLPPYGPAGAETLIVGGANVSRTAVAKFDAAGNLVWMKDLGLNKSAQVGAVLPDGRFVTAGLKGLDLVVALFDGDGNREWSFSQRPGLSITVEEIVVGEDGLGQPEFYVAGHIHHGSISSSDPALIKLDALGNILWAAYYALDGDDEVNGMTLTADGMLLLSGESAANVAPPPMGTPDSANVLKDATSSGLLMKIDVEDGLLLWANVYASRWGMNLEEVLESPDGTIYAAGAVGRIVTQDRPVNLFVKLDAEGNLLDHVSIGDDPDWEDELPDGGNSPYDLVTGLEWVEGGLWACGVTGLGAERAGWVMSLTDELGVKLFSVFDGPDAEICLDLADAGDGLAMLATTRSAYPWGSGGQSAPMLLKLPWEGLMRFHEDSGLDSLYLQPQVFHTSTTEEFMMLSRIENPGAPQTFSSSFSPAAFVQTPLTFTPGATVPAPLDYSAPTILAVEALERGLIESFADWVEYHQLTGAGADPDADDDGDGLSAIFEAFFGRNPYVAETTSPVTISAGEINGQSLVIIEFDRTTFSQSLGVTFESSEDLDAWLEATGLTETVQPLSPTQERVQLVAVQDVPIKFYRLVTAVVGTGSGSQ